MKRKAAKLTVSASKRTTRSLPYEKDFYRWTRTQASLLKKQDFKELDVENLIEEIESLGKSDKRALKNHLINLLMHLLKKEYQSSRRSRSWDKSIENARIHIHLLLEDSPSLKQELKKEYVSSYAYACKKAAAETGMDVSQFPATCPWKLTDTLGGL